jgi:hypothetical protein
MKAIHALPSWQAKQDFVFTLNYPLVAVILIQTSTTFGAALLPG